jgi:5-methyltetrahydropteroyltriglutamate--homocysteine methyltransferase
LKLQEGIDFIPSGDFSYYDNLLDIAFLLNIIPSRYKNLNLDDLDTYFALARGFQGDNGDVKSLAMKKWFNTNYHYIVPEYEDDIVIKLNGTKPFDEYIEAKSNGFNTIPTLIGPFTLLKLIRFTGNKKKEDIYKNIVDVYKELLNKFNELGAKWVSIQEPILVLDLNKDDINLFKNIYKLLLNNKNNKILLQTYFGDVRDIVDEINELGFDGVGLDLIEGEKTEDVIKKLNDNILLFLGVINGKNIWKNNYLKTINKKII